MVDTSVLEPARGPNACFPLMELPLEIRKMVYVELLLPEQDDGFEDPSRCDQKMTEEKNTDSTSLLLANKQIHKEALTVVYDVCYFKILVKTMWPDESHGESLRSCCKSYPREIRNLEISINTSEVSKWRRDVSVHQLVKRVAMLCSEMAPRFGRLRNIAIRIPCPKEECLFQKKARGVPFEVGFDYIQVEELNLILEPTRTLRASSGITLRCHKALQVEFDPSFQRLAGMVRGSDKVDERPMMERAWFSIRHRAERFFPENGLEASLQQAFLAMNEAHGERNSEMTRAFWWGIEYVEKRLELLSAGRR
ncbi:MAG: hypothetical protein Q9206_005390 [Seirophora lacunosa]